MIAWSLRTSGFGNFFVNSFGFKDLYWRISMYDKIENLDHFIFLMICQVSTSYYYLSLEGFCQTLHVSYCICCISENQLFFGFFTVTDIWYHNFSVTCRCWLIFIPITFFSNSITFLHIFFPSALSVDDIFAQT